MAKIFAEAVSRFGLYCGAVAEYLSHAWANICLALEPDSYQHEVLWSILWWSSGLVVCLLTVWGVIHAVAWVIGGSIETIESAITFGA